jgi:hypothetical protein
MTTKACKKSGRKHTPITSEAQRGFFGAELARKRAGKSTKTEMSEEELVRHLHEAKGKKLPRKSKKKRETTWTSQ